MVLVESFNDIFRLNQMPIERFSYVKDDLLSMTTFDPETKKRFEIFIKLDHLRGTLTLNSQELHLSLQSFLILPIDENQNIVKIVEY